VVGAPFQHVKFPQIAAIAKFQPNTAQGKLNAVITPITPKGFHYSIIKCSGLSDGIIFPFKALDNPHAISQQSINSYTSPRPSDLILPTSNDIRAPNADFFNLNASPI